MSLNLDMLKLKVEAILFATDHPLEAAEMRTLLGAHVALGDVRLCLRALARDYSERSFELFEHDNKYQLRTREEHMDVVREHYSTKPRSLSKSALETLAIIAYKQPLTRAQISALRGVDSSSIVQNLKEKELIYAAGIRKDIPGQPVEYRTTPKFLSTFGLQNIKELPHLRALQMGEEAQSTLKQMDFALQAEVAAAPEEEILSSHFAAIP